MNRTSVFKQVEVKVGYNWNDDCELLIPQQSHIGAAIDTVLRCAWC